MLKVKLMNKIAKVGTDVLSATKYEVGENVTSEDAIMVRSAALHEMPFSPNLRAIARCGAGVNNIPVDKIPEFEKQLEEHMDNYHSDVLNAIRSSGKLEQETEFGLKAALDQLLVQFTA